MVCNIVNDYLSVLTMSSAVGKIFKRRSRNNVRLYQLVFTSAMCRCREQMRVMSTSLAS